MYSKKFVQELIQINIKRKQPIETIEDIIETLENTKRPQTLGALARGKSRCAVGVLLERMGASQDDLIYDVNTERYKKKLNKILQEYEMCLVHIFTENDRSCFTFKQIAKHLDEKVRSVRGDRMFRDLQERHQAHSVQTSHLLCHKAPLPLSN